MSFPNIQFKATNVTLEEKWQRQVEDKFATLDKYLGYHTDSTCHVEFERITAHQSGDVCRVEVTLFVHGKTFRAESTEHSFEHAIDVVRKELESELRKAHQKHDTLIIRGRRKIKEWMRFGTK
jgi:ribosomal subunit interface protein